MYKKNTNQDFWGAIAAAAVGAGVVTAFAVSRGQNPLIAIMITGIAALSAVIIDRLGIL